MSNRRQRCSTSSVPSHLVFEYTDKLIAESNARRNDYLGLDMPFTMVQANIYCESSSCVHSSRPFQPDCRKILFLNKNDLFEEKIKNSHIKNFFPVGCYSFLAQGSCHRATENRISRANHEMPSKGVITLRSGLLGSRRKPAVRRSGRFTYSKCFTC